MVVRTEETLANILYRIRGFDRLSRSKQFSLASRVARFCGFELHPAEIRRAVKKAMKGGF